MARRSLNRKYPLIIFGGQNSKFKHLPLYTYCRSVGIATAVSQTTVVTLMGPGFDFLACLGYGKFSGIYAFGRHCCMNENMRNVVRACKGFISSSSLILHRQLFVVRRCPEEGSVEISAKTVKLYINC